MNPTCEVCNGPIGETNKIGVCSKNPTCAAEYHRRYHITNRQAPRIGEKQASPLLLRSRPTRARPHSARFRAKAVQAEPTVLTGTLHRLMLHADAERFLRPTKEPERRTRWRLGRKDDEWTLLEEARR